MASSKDVLASLGRAVKARREAMGLAQADLASRGGPGETTISRLERGDGAAPRNQTQDQLEHVLALPTGAVRGFLDAEEKKFAEGPHIISTNPEPLGGLLVSIRDQRLAEELQRQLGIEPQTVGDTFTPGNAELGRKALAVAGATRPIFPLTLVSVDSGAEFAVSNMSEFNNTFYSGSFALKERAPGMNFRVWEPPSQEVRPSGRPSETRAGDPTLAKGSVTVHRAAAHGIATTSGSVGRTVAGGSSKADVSRPRRPSFSRRRVERDGSVWQFRSALSRNADEIGKLPDRYLPLLAALEALEVGGLDEEDLDHDVRLFIEDQLADAHDALVNAVATLADTVVEEAG